MAVRPVLRMGDPRLKIKCDPVEQFDTAELHELIQDMRDTMAAEQGAGLAAIQIGVLLRVVLFGFDANPRYPDAPQIPETVLINPAIEFIGEEKDSAWEGCLSVPGMRGLVPRYRHIRYTGYDIKGNPIDRTVADFHARVVQHEVDHLDGILYPTRIENMMDFGFIEELVHFEVMTTVK